MKGYIQERNHTVARNVVSYLENSKERSHIVVIFSDFKSADKAFIFTNFTMKPESFVPCKLMLA